MTYNAETGAPTVLNLIDTPETVTTLVNNPDGTHVYTSEDNTTTTIDVVGDVTTNASTIFTNTDVINAVSPIVKGSETLTSLSYDGTANTLTYNAETGAPTVLNLVDTPETVTTLVNNPDGTHVYTSENNTATTIDVVGDVTTNAATIFTNTDVINAVSPIVKGNETLTSLSYDGTANTLTYNAETGAPTVLNLIDTPETVTTLVNNPDGTHVYTSENNTATTIDVVGDVTTNAATIFTNTDVINAISPIVKGNETLTSLSYDGTANTLTYNAETGAPTVLNLIDTPETVTTLVNNPDGTHVYTSENNTATTIDVVGDVTTNAATIFTNTDVINAISPIVKGNETLTSLSYDGTANTLTYNAETGAPTVLNLVDTPETVTTLVNNTDGTHVYTSEDNTATTIDVGQDVINNFTNILVGPRTDGGTQTVYDQIALEVKAEQTMTSLSIGSDILGNTALIYKDEGETENTLTVANFETPTFLTSEGVGRYTYVNEPRDQSTIDIVQDVADFFTNIAGQPRDGSTQTVRDILHDYTIEDQDITTLAYDAGTNIMTYNSEQGNTDIIDLSGLQTNITAGTNITLAGTGETASPYVIDSPLQTAAQTTNTPIAASTTSVAVPAINVQDAIANLAAELKQKWDIRGNTGTSAATNFLGTFDNVDLSLRRGNSPSGFIGTRSTSFGLGALSRMTTGNDCVAVGALTLINNTTGSSNTAMGYRALTTNTTGSLNVAIGDASLLNNTEGLNTAVGATSMNANTTGSVNAAFGYNALNRNTTGNNNTAIGASSLLNNLTGSDNTSIGYSSGRYFGGSASALTSINQSVFVGESTQALADNDTNEIVIGYGAIGRGSNTVQIGNANMTNIGGQVAWSNPSDLRLKKDIDTSNFGLNFITKLRPVTYHMKTGTQDLQSGFIAQEVEAAAKSVGYEFNAIVKPASVNDFYSLRYSDFVVPLVKAVQEQQIIIEKQDKKIADLQNRLQRLESIVDKLK